TADDHVTLVKAINKVLQSEIKNNGYNLNGEQYGNKVDESNKKWLLLPLSEVFIEIKNGKNVKQIDEKGKYRVSRIQTIANWNVDLNKTKWTNDNVDEKDFLTEGDILLSHINSIEHLGKNALFSGINEKVVHGINLLRLKPNQNLVLPKFISYVLHSKEFISKVLPFAQRAVNQASVNITNLKNITIPIPPLEIQKQLVEELDGYQEIIDGAKQIVENWKPNFKIDPEWEMIEIGNLAKVQGGFAFKSGDMTSDGEVQLIRIGNVQDQNFNVKRNPCFIEKSFYKKYENYQLHIGDILISMTGTNGKRDYGNVCIVDINGKFLLNQRVGRIIPNSKILNSYLYLSLNQKGTKDKFYQNSTGGIRQGNISGKQIESIKIPLPSIEKQQKIIDQIEEEKSMVDPLKKLIELYQEKINQKIKEVWSD
ncbi:MAG: restriction endonuclease subunit S, partial [Bacilli bacterium]|nr:restriction endonuclease subunit S [Bacilli bacterium]